MVVNFTLSAKAEILKQLIGKTIPYRHFTSSGHGRAVSLTVTGVTLDNHNSWITLRHDLKFEDDATGDYCTNGETFFDYYQPEIQKCLDKEIFWAVTEDAGVYPVMMNYAELKAENSWMNCHDYHGTLIFETYARAVLCQREKISTGCWAA